MLEFANRLYKTNRLFLPDVKFPDLLIKPLEKDEFDLMGKITARFHQNRFFDKEVIRKKAEKIYTEKELRNMTQEETQEAGGNLSIMFPNLKPNGIYGQSEESFSRYWQEQKDNPDFKAFIAKDKTTNKVLGFVTGDFKYINLQDFPYVTFPQYADLSKILSIGSLYMNPNPTWKEKEIGKTLISTFMLNSLIENDFKFSGFLTNCFWRDNSQFFLDRCCGARRIGFCDMPNRYIDEDGKTNIQNLTGEVMFWEWPNVRKLINSMPPILSEEEYTRKDSDYKTMEKVKGYMPEYLKLKKEEKERKKHEKYLDDLTRTEVDISEYIDFLVKIGAIE